MEIPTSQFAHYCGEIDAAVNEVIAARGGRGSLNARLAAIEDALGGLRFRKLSQEEFDALTEKDGSTVYYVISGGKVTQYLGDAELSGGTGRNTVTSDVQSHAAGRILHSIIAVAEQEES